MNILNHPPQTGEVWTVQDDKVVLHDENRSDKGKRFVLILMAADIDISALGIANILPLTTSAKPDKFVFPIARAYEDLVEGFTPDPISCAVVNFYQPIELKYFSKYRGKIDQTTQVALKELVVYGVLGLPEFDFAV